MRRKFLVLILLIAIALPLVGHAANPCSKEEGSLAKCVSQVYIWSLAIAAILALLMVILGGYAVMTAAGNAEQATKGKEMLWSAVMGLAVLFTAYLLLNTINPDLVNFTDPFSRLNRPTNQTQTQTNTTAQPPRGD